MSDTDDGNPALSGPELDERGESQARGGEPPITAVDGDAAPREASATADDFDGMEGEAPTS